MMRKLNNSKLVRIAMKPSQAVKLKNVTLNLEKYPKDARQEVTDGLYRYLLQPGEEHGDQKKRATDRTWSTKTFRLDRIVENPGQRVLYYLSDGPERAFVREELMLIPEDTEVPPEWVEKW